MRRAFTLLLGLTALFVACGEEDPTVVAAPVLKTIDVNASFPMAIDSTTTNGTVFSQIPFLEGTNATASNELVVDVFFTLGTNAQSLRGLYIPLNKRLVWEATVGTNAFTAWGEITATGFSGVITRTQIDADPADATPPVYIAAETITGTATTVTRAPRR